MADRENNQIQVFDAGGYFLRAWGNGGAGRRQFYWPSGLAISMSGNVYVTDCDNLRLQVFDIQGHFMREWGNGYQDMMEGSLDGLWESTCGIASGPDGKIYSTQMNLQKVNVFDQHGNFLQEYRWSI